eukprot:1927863-Prymnesium_polylepis.1
MHFVMTPAPLYFSFHLPAGFPASGVGSIVMRNDSGNSILLADGSIWLAVDHSADSPRRSDGSDAVFAAATCGR